jgi:hypothetical protein
MLQKAHDSANRQRKSTQNPQLGDCSQPPNSLGTWPTVQPVAHTKGTGPQPDAANDSMMQPRWLSVSRMAAEYSEVTTEAALRHLIWNAEAHARFPRAGLPSNGFLPVIVRPPFQRKVLLDRVAFEKWLTTNQA